MNLSDIAHEVEVKFEELWTRLIPHVVPEAVGDAQAVLADVKSQASQLVQQGVADGEKDVATVVADGEQIVKDAGQAVSAPTEAAPEVPAPAKGSNS